MPARPMSARSLKTWWLPLAAAFSVAACSPTLNWRETRVPGERVKALFPCKPSQERRSVVLAGAQVEMTVLACEAGGSMFAVGTADVGDPARVGAALAALRTAAVANVSGRAEAAPFPVKGSTPHPEAGAWRVAGTLPDGRAVDERLVVFPVGTRVYQATLFGARLSRESVEGFLGGLTLE